MGAPGVTTAGTRGGAVVPALDSGTAYSSRLSARSALFTDLQLLLDDLPGRQNQIWPRIQQPSHWPFNS
jgi:hypothetical protein